MKQLWVFLFVLITINTCTAGSLRNHIMERNITNVTKPSNRTSFRHIPSTRHIGLFPILRYKESTSNYNSNPKIKNEVEAIHTYNRTAVTRKVEIKRNQKPVDIVKVEITSRKPLIASLRFTKRPQQSYPEPVTAVSNGNSNRRIGKFNLAIYNRSPPLKIVRPSITE